MYLSLDEKRCIFELFFYYFPLQPFQSVYRENNFRNFRGTIQHSFAHRYIYFQFSPLLVKGINLIGCHRGILVLVCVHWCSLKVPVSFGKVGQVISCDFVNFCCLELRNFFATDILFS